MKVITKYLRIYFQFWRLAFSQGTVYRADTFFLLLSVSLYLLQNWTYFSSIFRSIPVVGGWTTPEYAFLLVTYSLNWGIFKLFYGRTMEDMIDKIFTGQFDYVLLRPISSRFLGYCCPPLIKGSLTNFLNLPLFLFVVLRFHLFTSWTNLFLYLLYLFIGQVIVFSFSQLAVVTSFFTNNASEVYAIFENAWDQSAYPGEAFTGSVFFILSYVVPIILFASFPARVFLGKVTNTTDFIFPVIVAVICLCFSNFCYRLGIKNYTSAGG